SGPDGIDERFGTLMGELRSGEATASPELRERVRAIAGREPEPPAIKRWRRLPRRRVALVLAPACALVAAAVVVGVFTSGGGRKENAIELSGRAQLARVPASPPRPPGTAAFIPHTHSLPVRERAAATGEAPGGNAYSRDATGGYTYGPSTGAGNGYAFKTLSNIPPSGSRAQLYAVDLSLRVSDLSDTTKQAINLTRGWGGYVVNVDSGSDRKSGTAYLELRIPIVKIQS